MISRPESTELVAVHYEARPPRRRDFLRVLLGRWQPEVCRAEYMTTAAMVQQLKEVWKSESLMQQFYIDNPTLNMLQQVDNDPRQDNRYDD